MTIYARGGYLDQKTRSPLGLGAAVAINGAVVGALLLAAPTVQPGILKVIKLIPIATEPPPPEPLPPPPPEPKQRAQTPSPEPMASKTPIAPLDTTFTLPPPQPVPPQPGTGDIGPISVVDPPHTPVFVGPQIDTRYSGALQPPYPPGKIRAEEEGVVVVRVRIGTDGRVKEVQKVEAADEAFYRATVEQAMKRWRFKPATSDGKPVEGWRTMTVRFELNDD